MSQNCSFCHNEIYGNTVRHFLHKIGKVCKCEFCLDDLNELFEINYIIKEIDTLKAQLDTLKGDKEENVADIVDIQKRIEKIEAGLS